MPSIGIADKETLDLTKSVVDSIKDDTNTIKTSFNPRFKFIDVDLFNSFIINFNSALANSETTVNSGLFQSVVVGNFIYVIFVVGVANSNFFRFNIIDKTWGVLANTPIASSSSQHGVLSTDGTNVFISSWSGNAFHRYNVSNNTWSTLSTPSVSLSSSELWVNKGNDIYYLVATSFRKYNTSTNVWINLSPLSGGDFMGGSGYVNPLDNNQLIFISANGWSTYTISTNLWSNIQSTGFPASPMRGVVINNMIYIPLGTNWIGRFNTSNSLCHTMMGVKLPPQYNANNLQVNGNGNTTNFVLVGNIIYCIKSIFNIWTLEV